MSEEELGRLSDNYVKNLSKSIRHRMRLELSTLEQHRTKEDTVMNDREVMKLALKALELEATSPPIDETATALAALRAALTAPPDAEVEALRRDAERTQWNAAKELRRLRADNERLRAALARYGIHGADCIPHDECKCGLDAALRQEQPR